MASKVAVVVVVIGGGCCCGVGGGGGGALGSGTDKNRDVSTGLLARPFAHLFAHRAHSFACSRPPLRSLVRSLAHFAHSLAHGKVNFDVSK